MSNSNLLFEKYLKEISEIGYVESITHSIVRAAGLPKAKPSEHVIFENGQRGQVLSMNRTGVEILMLERGNIKMGMKLVRTGDMFQIPLSLGYVGRTINPLGEVIDGGKPVDAELVSAVDTSPHGIIGRKQIESPFMSGVAIVDIVIPLGKGQRELIIGDRKTGKTDFLLQTVLNQAGAGMLCIYAVIGQRNEDIKLKENYFKKNKIFDKCILIASSSTDSLGLAYLTPYSAMTIAEYFRDKGREVLLILDDMTTHAKVYREISLLAKRFPGRNSYPGDIFYLHSRLIERAGNFNTGSITCLPVAETIMGDLSGFLQTNLMAMTDGHIYFDIDLYNEGKRPSISPFLSVTRVGHQAQSTLARDVSRQVLSFLVNYEKMKQFVHFGAETGETIRGVLQMGRKLDIFFTQSPSKLINVNISIVLLAVIWSGIWNEEEDQKFKSMSDEVYLNYQNDTNFRNNIDLILSKLVNFFDLVNLIRREPERVIGGKV